MARRELYLVWTEGELAEEDLRADFTCLMLKPGLFLVDWGDSLSKLYHKVKYGYLKRDDALLVSALAGQPKFKGMEEGALKWVRAWMAKNR